MIEEIVLFHSNQHPIIAYLKTIFEPDAEKSLNLFSLVMFIVVPRKKLVSPSLLDFITIIY